LIKDNLKNFIFGLSLKSAKKFIMQYIAHVSLVVHDYDEAIEFYTQKLGFELIEDTWLNEEKRWVVVRPMESTGCSLLLAKAASIPQTAVIGSQTGGRVFLFLYTTNFWIDYAALVAKGVSFVRPPQEHDYGLVAVFADLYGNLWDLLQPADFHNVIPVV
jgi:catechol 2,3-dioxygenase-like lactoylglutathione lyase family enzyme